MATGTTKRLASEIVEAENAQGGDTPAKRQQIDVKESRQQPGSAVSETNGDEEDASEEEHAEPSSRVQSTKAQDIHIARETAELFKSNIFKLQIDELLQQVKLKEAHILKIEKFLHRLYDIIQLIPAWESKSISEVDNFFKNKIVSVPFADPKPTLETTNYKFGYDVPLVSLIGSFALKIGIYQPQGSSIDVLLTMPEQLFEKKDFLNFRCLHKRSVYLAYFTHNLFIQFKKSNLTQFINLDYEYFNDDPLLPILKITFTKPTKENADYNFYQTGFSINILVGFPYKIFDHKKLLAHRNCIRIVQENGTLPLPATPLYNFAVLSSCTHEHYLKFLHRTKKRTEAFKEASILGRLWLKQRGFSSKLATTGNLGGFGPFEFTTLMAALLNGGGINGNKILLHGFSSYQLFKGVVKYLATMDLCESGHLVFQSDSTSESLSKYSTEGFHAPTVLDKSTKVNILEKMTISSYEILKMYSKQTLSMLNNVIQDQFANIFLTNIGKVDNIKYDVCYDIQLPAKNESNFTQHLFSEFTPLERVKHVTIENYLVHKLLSSLKFGLGDRITAIDVKLINHKSKFPISRRKVYSSSHEHVNFDFVRIKLLLNASECEKLVTKGPNHSETPTAEAIAFKKFWGGKCSLRKFKDGSINHCCVWTASPSNLVVSSIVKYVIHTQIFEALKVVDGITTQFQQLLPLANLPASNQTSILNLSSFYNVKKSFDELYKILFKMELPLAVKSVQPVGTAFRYTSLYQPVPFAYSSPDFFQDVILEFETSPKWPDEITSLEKSKTAFLLKIQEELSSKYGSSYRSFFTRDESIPFNLEIVTLNVLTPEGYGFKIRVLTERDEILYLRAISNCRAELKPELERTFLKFTAKYQASVRHTRTIESISHFFQFYSPVVRLFKKWLDVHLLFGHLGEELVELIAMKPFIDAQPYFLPSSLENGFLKLLNFLSEWNWKEDPLVLDLVRPADDTETTLETSVGAGSELSQQTIDRLSGKLNLAQYKDIQANFRSLRKSDPNGLHLQFFVASKVDPSGILYSSSIPLPIATRLTALAKVALNLIKLHGLNKQTIDLLFTPALKDYDFVVHLKAPVPLKAPSGILDYSEFKNLANNTLPHEFPKNLENLSEKMDPTHHLVKYLNMKYKNSIIFSSHKYIGVNGSGDTNVITALIKPLFKSPRKFKATMDCNVKPLDDEMVVLNKDAIFHEIAAFSGDMLVGITTTEQQQQGNT